MNLELDKILKSAEYVFEGVKDAEQAIDYIRVLVDKFHDRQAKNALVQINAPGMVMVSEYDLDQFKALQEKYNNLKESYDALSRNYDQLEDRECNTYEENLTLNTKVTSLTQEVEHLKKSRGMCQLDSAGVCTYCEKRVILAKDMSSLICKTKSED